VFTFTLTALFCETKMFFTLTGTFTTVLMNEVIKHTVVFDDWTLQKQLNKRKWIIIADARSFIYRHI